VDERARPRGRAPTGPVGGHTTYPPASNSPYPSAHAAAHGDQAEDVEELTRLLRAAADGDRLALSSFIRQAQQDVWRTAGEVT
jgi:hypothetical protein